MNILTIFLILHFSHNRIIVQGIIIPRFWPPLTTFIYVPSASSTWYSGYECLCGLSAPWIRGTLILLEIPPNWFHYLQLAASFVKLIDWYLPVLNRFIDITFVPCDWIVIIMYLVNYSSLIKWKGWVACWYIAVLRLEDSSIFVPVFSVI